jgi:transcriptional regulator with XRE-family HTH domain
MRLQEIGRAVRTARMARGLTQAGLAASVGLARETLNLLENGLVRELGIRKIIALLEKLDLDLAIEQRERPRRPDSVRMACITANVSFKSVLTEDELIQALFTGKVPPRRGAHLRALLDEAPAVLLEGLAIEATRWISRKKLERNLARLAHDSGASRRTDQWLKID